MRDKAQTDSQASSKHQMGKETKLKKVDRIAATYFFGVQLTAPAV